MSTNCANRLDLRQCGRTAARATLGPSTITGSPHHGLQDPSHHPDRPVRGEACPGRRDPARRAKGMRIWMCFRWGSTACRSGIPTSARLSRWQNCRCSARPRMPQRSMPPSRPALANEDIRWGSEARWSPRWAASRHWSRRGRGSAIWWSCRIPMAQDKPPEAEAVLEAALFDARAPVLLLPRKGPAPQARLAHRDRLERGTRGDGRRPRRAAGSARPPISWISS